MRKMSVFGPEKRNFSALSIDWDVFHDLRQFMPSDMSCCFDWVVEYSRWSGDFNNSYRFQNEEFKLLKEYLSGLDQKVFVAENHMYLYDLVPEGANVHITNLDFHEDSVNCPSVELLSCANWLSALRRFKDCSVVVDWRQIHTKGKFDATLRDNTLDISHSLGFDGVFDKNYDLVFISQSYPWSPPHMNHRFRELLDVCEFPVLVEECPPVYYTYTERYELTKTEFEWGYFPTGSESAEELDKIHDDEELHVVWPVSVIAGLVECDPRYRR